MTPAGLLLTLALPLWAAKRLPPPPPHPLDPLTQEEIASAISVVRAAKISQDDSFFPVVALQEPPKNEVLIWKEGAAVDRQALVVVYDRKRNETSEATVDLARKELSSWRVIPGAQPSFLVEELTSAAEIINADPRYKEALAKRGITDPSGVHIEPWAPGTVGLPTGATARLARALFFYKGTSTNRFARPIEGLIALIDLNARKVTQFIDTGAVPLGTEDGDYNQAAVAQRPQPKPMGISQPLGPDFERRGQEIRWQNWRFRFGIHPREGVILYQVGYEDGGQVRPVLYRASLSEMVVPYGDPDPNWSWRSAFDEGEYGLGRLISPLDIGVDVPENAVTFDAPFSDDWGRAYILPRAAALYERDGGLLWKHFDFEGQRNDSRRGRELVLMSMAAIGNYDYGFAWVFKQDGSIEAEVLLTGIMLPKGVAVSTDPAHAGHAGSHMHLVAPGVAAPHHQHFFNYRLDFEVDGPANTVVELDTRMLPAGKANLDGVAMAVDELPLKTEKGARRDLNAATNRRWVVRNPGARNALGQTVGYAIVPGENTVPFVRPESLVRKRAAFIDHHLWVTAYDAEQYYAAGDYPNQARGRAGLGRWTDDDDAVESSDLVVWYTLGVTHVPRPEEWPVMPVAKAGFKLIPASFFSRNPALGVPRPLPSKRK